MPRETQNPDRHQYSKQHEDDKPEGLEEVLEALAKRLLEFAVRRFLAEKLPSGLDERARNQTQNHNQDQHLNSTLQLLLRLAKHILSSTATKLHSSPYTTSPSRTSHHRPDHHHPSSQDAPRRPRRHRPRQNFGGLARDLEVVSDTLIELNRRGADQQDNEFYDRFVEHSGRLQVSIGKALGRIRQLGGKEEGGDGGRRRSQERERERLREVSSLSSV
jgi:site-specific DNA-cytosine methylase